MDPDAPTGPPTREEFNRLSGYVLGLTNALRALIAAAPSPSDAVSAVERCFATEAAMGQSAEHIDGWTLGGLRSSLDELTLPIQHGGVVDSDPEGRIAQAEEAFRARQQAWNAGD